MALNRRELIKHLGLLVSISPLLSARVLGDSLFKEPLGNFQYIYANSQRREYFYAFLENVFHLYPEAELNALIVAAVKLQHGDAAIYTEVQKQLAVIKPFVGDLRYALPALNKQKKVIAEQTVQLVGSKQSIEGYLEVGSSGRYKDSLEEHYNFVGSQYFIAEKAPTHSLADMIDRGQPAMAGNFFLLDNYSVDIARLIPKKSLDLVTVYIGFHHCPIPLRDQFISSIRDVLKPNGFLVVRDHDAHDEDMLRHVALAHDVFNMGTQETWQYNAAEQRYFYSLATLNELMSKNGFVSDGRKLYQAGDPTLNALMLYQKA